MSEAVATAPGISREPSLDRVSAAPAAFPGGGVEPSPRLFARLVNHTPFGVGAILLIAAALKARYVAETRSWLDAAVVEAEIVLGLAVVLGAWQGIVRWLLLFLFLAFFFVSVSKASAGLASCGCIGEVPVPPWFTAFFDAAVLIALWFWQPRTCYAEPRRLVIGAAIALSLGFVVLPFWFSSVGNYPHLEVSPRVMDLGVVRLTDRPHFFLALHNPHRKQVVLDRIEVSCPCIRVLTPVRVFEPGSTVRWEVELNTGVQSKFTGHVRVKITGKTSEAQTAVFSEVIMHVVDASSSF